MATFTKSFRAVVSVPYGPPMAKVPGSGAMCPAAFFDDTHQRQFRRNDDILP
jgi:hypothetical protein